MNKFTTIPEPRVKWARHKTDRKPEKPIPVSEIFDSEQMMKYQNATDKQRKWVDEFLRTGDSDLSARIAYPTAKVASVYQLSLHARRKFKLTKKELENFMKVNPIYQ
ncbi:MAG: hypothetical protein WC846_02420 [Candidatus Gracilibacteria bacterium]|jgi:hypothetical protein